MYRQIHTLLVAWMTTLSCGPLSLGAKANGRLKNPRDVHKWSSLILFKFGECQVVVLTLLVQPGLFKWNFESCSTGDHRRNIK